MGVFTLVRFSYNKNKDPRLWIPLAGDYLYADIGWTLYVLYARSVPIRRLLHTTTNSMLWWPAIRSISSWIEFQPSAEMMWKSVILLSPLISLPFTAASPRKHKQDPKTTVDPPPVSAFQPVNPTSSPSTKTCRCPGSKPPCRGVFDAWMPELVPLYTPP